LGRRRKTKRGEKKKTKKKIESRKVGAKIEI